MPEIPMIRKVSFENFVDAYRAVVDGVMNRPDHVSSPRGKSCREVLGVSFVVEDVMTNQLFDNRIRSLPRKYLAKELALYYSGRNDIEGFAKASKFWKGIVNSDGTVNSAYGFRIFVKQNAGADLSTQWEWAKRSLIQDKDTRQAVMFVSGSDVQRWGVKDFICTLDYHFFIRDNVLYLIVDRRSQDIFKGLPYDAVWEMSLVQAMRLELLTTYPDLRTGTVTFNVHSLHAYEEDFEILNEMLSTRWFYSTLPAMFKSPVLSRDMMLISHGTSAPDVSDPFVRWVEENSK